MSFTTFTLPNNHGWFIYDESPELKQAWIDADLEPFQPTVQLIPDTFLASILRIRLDKGLDADEAWHYAAKVIEEALK